MAITAAMTLSSATATAMQAVMAICTITNGNSTAANLIGTSPSVTVQGGAAAQSVAGSFSTPSVGPNSNTLIPPNNGTLVITWPVLMFAPFEGAQSGVNNPANPNSVVYTVGATVQTTAAGADAFVSASTTTLTISAPTSH